MYIVTKQDIHKLWNRFAQKISKRADVLKGYIKDELDDDWQIKFSSTLQKIINSISNDEVIIKVGTGAEHITSDYMKPNNTILGSLMDAGCLVLGDSVNSNPDKYLSKPSASFEEAQDGKILTPSEWNRYLKVISKYFELNWSFSPVDIQPIMLTSVNGIYSGPDNKEEFYRFSMKGSIPFEFSYIIGYKSNLISADTGAMKHNMDDFEFVTYLLSDKGGIK